MVVKNDKLISAKALSSCLLRARKRDESVFRRKKLKSKRKRTEARNNHVAPGRCKSVEFTARGDDTAVLLRTTCIERDVL